MKKTFIIFLVALSLVGFVDAAYLTAKHFQGVTVTCSIGGKDVGDCGLVLESTYGTILGVPVALLGSLYYFILFALSAFLLTHTSRTIDRIVFIIVSLGLIASAWFVYLQFFVLKALCPYCLFSSIVSLLLFLVGVFFLRGSLRTGPTMEESLDAVRQ